MAKPDWWGFILCLVLATFCLGVFVFLAALRGRGIIRVPVGSATLLTAGLLFFTAWRIWRQGHRRPPAGGTP